MNIHIRGPVEFEKILNHSCETAIETTRARMAVQQLLDTQESSQHLTKQLRKYIEMADKMLAFLSQHHTQPLVEHPLFEWSVNDAIILTPCWRIETILPRFALAVALQHAGHGHVADESFKDAAHAFQEQHKLHLECASKLLLWKWKLSHLNHDVLQHKWHVSQADICKGMADLCMLATGIQKQTASKAMFTVSQRALRHFARSLATWPTTQAKDLMNVSEAMRYYYSSDILWSDGQYGQSIYQLETWDARHVEFGPFQSLKTELGKIPFLAQERRHTNDGAYFDAVAAPEPLAAADQLIHTPESTDIPHPSASPAWDAADEATSTPSECSDSQ